MPTCQDCGGYVTRDFVRVFGLNGAVAGCPDCTTYRELTEGGGAEDVGESREPVGEQRPT
ncbi:hypothetical protein GWG54_12175 [Natronococcus sp. JC468]|nr:hypothetical protein [Natronococcus sp. JC468]